MLFVLMVEVFELVLDHLQDVLTGMWVGCLQLQHLSDFIECEAETLRALDQAKAIYSPRLIEAIAAACPRRRRQESASLIVTKRVNTDAASRGRLTNTQNNRLFS